MGRASVLFARIGRFLSSERGAVAFITVVPLLFALVHFIWPSRTVDSVTAALILIAVAPWLLPLISQYLKSFKFGGVEVELIQQQVRELEIKQIATPARKLAERLEALGSYYDGYRRAGYGERAGILLQMNNEKWYLGQDAGTFTSVTSNYKGSSGAVYQLRALFSTGSRAWNEIIGAPKLEEHNVDAYMQAVLGYMGEVRQLANAISSQGLEAQGPETQSVSMPAGSGSGGGSGIGGALL
jgi:hypothetical protein